VDEQVIKCGMRLRRGVMGMINGRAGVETVGWLSLCVLSEGNKLTAEQRMWRETWPFCSTNALSVLSLK
jgi:hypothetical protein